MYGYLHRGRVIKHDPATGSFELASIGLARTSRWGPVPSAVPGIVVGDRVILGATGTSRDDLVIIAKVGADFPDIGDIPGLQAALDAKADDSEITAINGTLDDINGDLATMSGILLDHEGRLDTAEPTIADHESRLGIVEPALSAQGGRIAYLENSVTTDRDLFGDLLSSLPRNAVTNAVAMANGTLLLVRLYCKAGANLSFIRVVTTVAGTVGNCAIGLYAGSVTSSLALVRSGTITLGGPGRINHTLSSLYNVSTASQLVVAFLPLSYTIVPQLGGKTGVVHAAMLNPNPAFYSSVTKAGVATLPATIDLTDGTWNGGVTSLPWVAFG